MKIFHIIGSIEIGGAERVLETLINHTNVKNFIYVIGKKKDNEITLKKNTEVIYLNYNIFLLFNLLKKISFSDPINFWHHNSFFLSIIFFINNKKNIFWHIHNYKIDPKTFGKINILFFFINILFSSIVPKKIIFCSKMSLELHKNFYFSLNKLVFIKNPIDQLRINKKRFIHNKVEKIKFVMVANYMAAKNFDRLFYLMSLIKNYIFSLDLYGKGIKNNKKLLSLINKYKLSHNIRLNPFSDSKYIFLKYDYSLLISHSESLPISILESIIACTPPIASDIGGIRNLIKNKKFLIPNNINKKTINFLNNLHNYRNSKEYISKSIIDRDNIINEYSINTIYPIFYKLWKIEDIQY